MAQISPQQIVEKLDELPRELKLAFLGLGVDKKTESIGKKYNLNPDQIRSLVNPVRAIALGLLGAEDFKNTIVSSIGVSVGVAEIILQDVSEIILKEVKKVWMESLSKEDTSEEEEEIEIGKAFDEISDADFESVIDAMDAADDALPDEEETHRILVEAGIERDITVPVVPIGVSGYSLRPVGQEVMWPTVANIQYPISNIPMAGRPSFAEASADAKALADRSAGGQKLAPAFLPTPEEEAERERILAAIENPSGLPSGLEANQPSFAKATAGTREYQANKREELPLTPARAGRLPSALNGEEEGEKITSPQPSPKLGEGEGGGLVEERLAGEFKLPKSETDYSVTKPAPAPVPEEPIIRHRDRVDPYKLEPLE